MPPYAADLRPHAVDLRPHAVGLRAIDLRPHTVDLRPYAVDLRPHTGDATHSTEASQAETALGHWTPALLGAIAGAVDAAGWVALAGLLPSHLTASLVMLGTTGERDSAEVTARLAMIPVFILTVALVKSFARWLSARNLPVLQTLLTLQTFALGAFCMVGSLSDSLLADDPRVLLGIGGVGVASMAVQNAIMRLCLSKTSPTTVMTGNLTQFVIGCVDLAALQLGADSKADADTRARVQQSGLPLLGFVLGSIACGYFAGRSGLVCLTLPLALSALITFLSWRTHRHSTGRRGEPAAATMQAASGNFLPFPVALFSRGSA